MEDTYYLPLAGTGDERGGWVIDDNDPFTLFMRSQNFKPLRRPDGSPLLWSAKLNGLLGMDDAWTELEEALLDFLPNVPFEHRNLFAHSHGGQGAIKAAARGLPLRSLTTIGTPRRRDIPAEQAVKYIHYWQHLCDSKSDWTATLRKLGQVGDGHIGLERRFLISGVVNRSLEFGHSSLLKDPTFFHYWIDNGWLDAVRNGTTSHPTGGGYIG